MDTTNFGVLWVIITLHEVYLFSFSFSVWHSLFSLVYNVPQLHRLHNAPCMQCMYACMYANNAIYKNSVEFFGTEPSAVKVAPKNLCLSAVLESVYQLCFNVVMVM